MSSSPATDKKILETLPVISQYMAWSEDKTERMHKNDGFPMVKIGGRWVSHKDKIESWVKIKIIVKSTEG